MNHLYYGDNLDILRTEIAPESVDLIYLDPPFNSNASYNVLFRSPEGSKSKAQIEAFDDTWHWGEDAESCYNKVLESGNTRTIEMLRAMREFLQRNDMMAYLAMMAVRLLELHKVLKPTGSLYLHCDPTASHYLKILLDSVFGERNFGNEIVWCYTQGGRPKKGFPRKHDTIFRYSKSQNYIFNVDQIKISYELLSKKSEDSFTKLDEEGRYYKEVYGPGKKKKYKYYKDEGKIPYDWWTDIHKMTGRTAASKKSDYLGYPTQKPLTLLERIVKASSNEGDVVLDPFCGCGTTIHAAEKLRRKWIGIDITHLAISLIEKRLNDAFPEIKYEVYGTPKDWAGAEALALTDKYQFEWWAVSLVNAQPWGGKKKGADKGIDGVIYFTGKDNKTEKAIVSVKGGKNVGVAMIRDLVGVLKRENSPIGLFLTLAKPTRDMIREAAAAGIYDAYGIKCPRVQILTIKELLEGKTAKIPLLDRETFRQAPIENKDQKKLV